MTSVVARRYSDLPWIRNAHFDTWFILGLIGIPLTVLAVLTLHPALFFPILLIDLWLLGYHHVISTFTRLTFDKQSFRENRFIIFGITPIVAIVTGLIAWLTGIWAIVTIYFYWSGSITRVKAGEFRERIAEKTPKPPMKTAGLTRRYFTPSQLPAFFRALPNSMKNFWGLSCGLHRSRRS